LPKSIPCFLKTATTPNLFRMGNFPVLVFLFLILSLPVAGQEERTPENLFKAAEQESDITLAAGLFRTAGEEFLRRANPADNYNAALSFSKAGDSFHGVLILRKILAEDPAHFEAEKLLEKIRKANDARIDTPGNFSKVVFLGFVSPEILLAFISALVLVMWAVLFMARRKNKSLTHRVFRIPALMIVSVVTLFYAGRMFVFVPAQNALINAPDTVLLSLPNAGADKIRFENAYGLEVETSDKSGNYVQISTPRGEKGWVKSESVTYF